MQLVHFGDWGLHMGTWTSYQDLHRKASNMLTLAVPAQDLNPLPFSITIANTVIWLAYGAQFCQDQEPSLLRDPLGAAKHAQ